MTVKYANKVAALAVVGLLLWPMAAAAATMQSGDTVSIAQGSEIADNLYVAGGNLSVGSRVDGDLYGAGGNVLVTGPVTNDIVLAGGSVNVLGDSGGDVRVAGGNLLIADNINGELIALGGTITLSPGATVMKDVTVAGGQITLDGDIMGDVEVTGGDVTINGHVHGNVVAQVDGKLTFGDGAAIDGNVAYKAKSSDALVRHSNAIISGQTVFEQVKTTTPTSVSAKNAVLAFFGVFFLYRLFTTIVAALILTWLFKRFSNGVVNSVSNDPLRMLGYGFVSVVVIPVAAVLLLVTVLGIPLGAMTFMSYGLLLLVASIYSGVVLGAWLDHLRSSNRERQLATITWKNVLGGVVLLALIKLVPIIGWLVALAIFLVTIGAITTIVRDELWARR